MAGKQVFDMDKQKSKHQSKSDDVLHDEKFVAHVSKDTQARCADPEKEKNGDSAGPVYFVAFMPNKFQPLKALFT